MPSFSLAIIDPISASISSKVCNVLTELLAVKAQFVDTSSLLSIGRSVIPMGTLSMLFLLCELVGGVAVLDRGESFGEDPFVGTMTMFFFLPPCQLAGEAAAWGKSFGEHPFVGTMKTPLVLPPCQLAGTSVAWDEEFGVDGRSSLLHRLLLIGVLGD
jgi:hypothetical protein